MTNHKFQINLKSQIQSTKQNPPQLSFKGRGRERGSYIVLDFGNWNLFGIWNLEFRISHPAGFTLMELMVGVGIIVMLLVLTIVNFQSFQSSATLEIEADKFASALRQAQLWALSGQRVNTERPRGYGIRILPCATPPCSYVFFADVYPASPSDPNYLYDDGLLDTVIATTTLPKDIVIPNTTPSYPSTVVFVPPKGNIFINGSETAGEFVVDFQGPSGSVVRRVRLNRASGRVNLE